MNILESIPVVATDAPIEISRVKIDNESYFKISNNDVMNPFFMSIVSDSNHWMFIASNGGLSAGRKDANNALFPYYTSDKITESAEITGSKTIVQVHKNDKKAHWTLDFSKTTPSLIKKKNSKTNNNIIINDDILFDLFKGKIWDGQDCSSSYI